MKEQEYFITAQPAVTDDDGFLSYLWRGILYLDRPDRQEKEFQPAVVGDMLF